MGKSSGAKQRVTEYTMSMHIGLCAEVDAVLEIQVGEKTAWVGEVSTEGAIDIDQPALFGGIKKEGGVRGFAYLSPGGPLQTTPTSLAARLGLTKDNCPGFRGLAALWFIGSGVADTGWLPVPGGTSGGGGGSGGGSGDGWTPPGGGGGFVPDEMIVVQP